MASPQPQMTSLWQKGPDSAQTPDTLSLLASINVHVCFLFTLPFVCGRGCWRVGGLKSLTPEGP